MNRLRKSLKRGRTTIDKAAVARSRAEDEASQAPSGNSGPRGRTYSGSDQFRKLRKTFRRAQTTVTESHAAPARAEKKDSQASARMASNQGSETQLNGAKEGTPMSDGTMTGVASTASVAATAEAPVPESAGGIIENSAAAAAAVIETAAASTSTESTEPQHSETAAAAEKADVSASASNTSVAKATTVDTRQSNSSLLSATTSNDTQLDSNASSTQTTPSKSAAKNPFKSKLAKSASEKSSDHSIPSPAVLWGEAAASKAQSEHEQEPAANDRPPLAATASLGSISEMKSDSSEPSTPGKKGKRRAIFGKRSAGEKEKEKLSKENSKDNSKPDKKGFLRRSKTVQGKHSSEPVNAGNELLNNKVFLKQQMKVQEAEESPADAAAAGETGKKGKKATKAHKEVGKTVSSTSAGGQIRRPAGAVSVGITGLETIKLRSVEVTIDSVDTDNGSSTLDDSARRARTASFASNRSRTHTAGAVSPLAEVRQRMANKRKQQAQAAALEKAEKDEKSEKDASTEVNELTKNALFKKAVRHASVDLAEAPVVEPGTADSTGDKARRDQSPTKSRTGQSTSSTSLQTAPAASSVSSLAGAFARLGSASSQPACNSVSSSSGQVTSNTVGTCAPRRASNSSVQASAASRPVGSSSLHAQQSPSQSSAAPETEPTATPQQSHAPPLKGAVTIEEDDLMPMPSSQPVISSTIEPVPLAGYSTLQDLENAEQKLGNSHPKVKKESSLGAPTSTRVTANYSKVKITQRRRSSSRSSISADTPSTDPDEAPPTLPPATTRKARIEEAEEKQQQPVLELSLEPGGEPTPAMTTDFSLPSPPNSPMFGGMLRWSVSSAQTAPLMDPDAISLPPPPQEMGPGFAAELSAADNDPTPYTDILTPNPNSTSEMLGECQTRQGHNSGTHPVDAVSPPFVGDLPPPPPAETESCAPLAMPSGPSLRSLQSKTSNSSLSDMQLLDCNSSLNLSTCAGALAAPMQSCSSRTDTLPDSVFGSTPGSLTTLSSSVGASVQLPMVITNQKVLRDDQFLSSTALPSSPFSADNNNTMSFPAPPPSLERSHLASLADDVPG
eukprot:scpid60850/ scgid22232/ 